MEKLSDSALIDRYFSFGDRQALESLLRKHISKVWSLAYSLVLNEADADDITQDVFLRILENIRKFRGQSAFGTWLYRITVNSAKNFKNRKLACEKHIKTEFVEGFSNSAIAAPNSQTEENDKSEIRALLENLPTKLREALVLICIEELPFGFAAEIAGCSRATLYWRLHKARKQMKHEMMRRKLL